MESPPRTDRAGQPLELVFGASGYIGSHLVPYLSELGRRVRASSRHRDKLAAREWTGVELVAADALEPESLEGALKDVSVAYYLVHSMAAGKDFGRLDLEAAGNFASAAAEAGVQRIVYLGGLVPGDAESEHIVSRRETGEVLREGSVPVTELRAGIIVGPGSAAFEVMRDLVFHLPVMVTPRWVRAKSPPIALANLLVYLARIPHVGDEGHRIYDAAGPETLTYHEMMRVLAAAAGRRPPLILPVPVLTPRLSSYWLRLVTAVPTNVARALIEGLKHDFSADDRALRERVPQKLMGFREAVEAAFQAEREHTVQARWTEGAFPIRQRRLDYAYYAKRAAASVDARASPAAVWHVLRTIGGDTRYFYLDGLWFLRELLDWMVGGPGLNRGRRHPEELRVGDHVDSWEVVGVEPSRRLSLAFGMKAPGAGIMEFDLEPRGDGGTRLTTTLYWHPAGVWGLLYWMAFSPVHGLLLRGMTQRICERARDLPASPPGP